MPGNWWLISHPVNWPWATCSISWPMTWWQNTCCPKIESSLDKFRRFAIQRANRRHSFWATMAIFRRKTPPIQVGDRYMKANDQTRKVWEVSRLWTAVDGVPHARMVNRHETIMVSIRTLEDPEYFAAVPVIRNEP
ncbi:hypothetical protein amb2184 [Paramagnetospirillum magneticum AMB-1]|uniref:Uncharacterized protein n=2 Tax=Paramagnetospirillum magneticum TaxID=84159 RepID=Q2W587_PARM1|nr:hypothetical protein amb2184 [Paramagnetospirillum magneticum AMB-1]